MKLIELWPTYQSFEKDIIDSINLSYNKPFWNDNNKCYTPNEIIYESLISYYYNRELLYDSKIFIGYFKIMYVEFKPFMYKRQLIFYDENIEKLKNLENWGKLNINKDNINRDINMDKKYESKNKDLTSSQSNNTTFDELNDNDKVSQRVDININTTENNTSKEETKNYSENQEYDINNKIQQINSKTILLGLVDFLGVFNELFLPYKILKNCWNAWHS